jgi:Domain of unknown function (DUF1508)
MTTRPFQPEYYTDDEGKVRWRVRGANGEIIDSSSEGFENLRKAWDNYSLGLQGVQVSYEEAKDGFNATAGDTGSAREETDSDAGEEGTRGSEAGSSGEDDEDS